MGEDEEEGLTYAEAGVDIAASEAATAALLDAASREQDAAFAGIIDLDGQHLGLTTDGVGTKLLVAEALDRYDTVGIDCIAMNVNDLIAEGLRPIGFVDYLALEAPDDALTAEIGRGLANGAALAGITLMGGETAILPEVIDGVDLAGAAVGIAQPSHRPSGSVEPGDALVGLASSGIHSNGLTLARKAIERDHAFDDAFPPGSSHTIGEELLEPTRIYAGVVEVFEDFDIHACAHITGGGLQNLLRMAKQQFVIDNPPEVPPVFEFIQTCGDISIEEMYNTFNMGIGFVLAVDAAVADDIAMAVDGDIIGHVSTGHGVTIDGVDLEPAN